MKKNKVNDNSKDNKSRKEYKTHLSTKPLPWKKTFKPGKSARSAVLEARLNVVSPLRWTQAEWGSEGLGKTNALAG